MAYLYEWENSVKSRKTYTLAQRNKMLSRQTREGLKITGMSCIGVPKYILSEKFCQDSVEFFFGKQRARGGRNENPNVKQFMDNTVSLRVQGSVALEPARGNCRKRASSCIVPDNTPLPKRKRYKRSL